MPTYDYVCHACGQQFEAFQSMKDAPLTVCRKCGAEGKVKRQIGTGAGLIFKGTGFYETDYKRVASPGGGDAAKGDAGGGEKSAPATPAPASSGSSTTATAAAKPAPAASTAPTAKPGGTTGSN